MTDFWPGFGGTLVAETTSGVTYCSERCSSAKERQTPEDLGREAAWLLLEEVGRGGVVDSAFQSLALLFITFGQKDVSQIITGPLSPYT